MLSKIIARGLQSYWRLSRGATLAAEACLIDTSNRVGLVKSSSDGGWLLPRTAVRKGEAMEEALQCVFRDTYGIEFASGLDPFWVYDDGDGSARSGGWVGLFVIRGWTTVPTSAGQDLTFFDLADLPPGLDARDAARICQAAEGRAPFEVC